MDRSSRVRSPALSVLTVGFAMAAPAGALMAGSARAQQLPLSYRVTAEAGGSTWGEWTVTQGEEVSVVHYVDPEGPGAVALVAGAAVGGLAAQPKDDHGGLLSSLFDPEAGLGPGFWKDSGYGDGTAVVDSLVIELRDGEPSEAIDGHDTRHQVLTARLWWRHVADDGTETEIFETGAADLWFASDLPFSWVPFAVPPASPGHAFPLAHSWPEVASAVIGRHGARLEGLGLLLRARVKDEIRPGESPAGSLQFASMDSERSLSVSDVAAAPQPPDAGSYAELPQITHPRMAVLELALFLLEPCAALESTEDGTFEFATSGRRSYLASGSGALFLTDDGVENSSVVVAGTVRDGSAECTVIMLPGDGPREGTFAVASPNSRFAQPALDGSDGTDTAIGLHALAGESGLQRILVFDGGQVRIERADAEAVSGKVEAKAWVLELDPRYPRRLFEDLAVELTFEAVPGTRGR